MYSYIWEGGSFQRPENVWSSGSGRRDEELRNYVGSDLCEIIGRRRFDGSDACDPDGAPMKVLECDGHGKVDRALVKSVFVRDVWSFPFSSQGGGTKGSLEYLLRIKTALNWYFRYSVLSPKGCGDLVIAATDANT
jgi:hypothetical protein